MTSLVPSLLSFSHSFSPAGRLTVSAPPHPSPTDFVYNAVFCGATTQAQLYERLVWRMTRDVMFGYSATIFVYGQTASGKTWTMFGPSMVNPETGVAAMPDRALWGVVPRVCDQILSTLNREHATVYDFEVSYVEIYQDRIHDLLNGGKKLDLEEVPTGERELEFRLKDPCLVGVKSMEVGSAISVVPSID